MPFWTGIAGKARRIIAPFIGVGGKARRVMKGYIGVGGKARIFYDYLDDIDHVEIEFYDIQVYDNITSDGGNKLASGKTACSAYGATVTFDGVSVTVSISGTQANQVLYTHFRYYAVLKDGYRLRLDYPKTNDSKEITVTISWGDFYYQGSMYWFMYYWILGNTESGPETEAQNRSGSATHSLISGYSGGLREINYYPNRITRHKFTFGNVVIGGKTYSVTVKDSIAA